MNIFAAVEKYMSERDGLRTPLYYLLVSFSLFLMANWAGFSNIDYVEGPFTKKMGLYWSVNWTVTFLIMYPVFISLAVNAAKDIRGFWRDVVIRRLVTGPDGAKKATTKMLEEWDAWLGKSNFVAIAFVFISVAIGVTDFVKTAAGPLSQCKISFFFKGTFDAPLDWATMPIVNTNCHGKLFLLFTSSLFYLLMVASLAFFLPFLYYSGAVFSFLSHVSRRDGESRLVYRENSFERGDCTGC